MIIMKYNGGLGNQMFQYAAAITLANKLNTEAKFDTSFFNKRYAREFGLSIFGIKPEGICDIRIPLYWNLRRYIKFKSVFGLNIYSEDEFFFEKRFEQIKDNTFIEGFFQSPKYFDDTLTRNAFTFKNPLIGLNKEFAKSISSTNAVSIHIRRGDYVKKPQYQKLFNELTLEYYKKAQKNIEEKVQNPVYYVFSDDIAWVKENLGFENSVYTEHNSTNPSEDMRLMSLCKHNIIANSSFSWWGAYLNSNPQKVVIAPKKWFNDTKMPIKDLYPSEWTSL